MTLVRTRSRQNVSDDASGLEKKLTNAIAIKVKMADALNADFKVFIMPVL